MSTPEIRPGFAPRSPEPFQRFIYVRLPIALTALIGAEIALAFFVVPHFQQIFRDFNVDLPAFTKFVLLMMQWTTDDYGWLILLPIPVVVPIVAANFKGPNAGTARLAVIVISLSLAFLVVLLTILALFPSIFALTESVSKHK